MPCAGVNTDHDLAELACRVSTFARFGCPDKMIYRFIEPGYMMSRTPNLDEYLEMVGLWRKLVPRDGRCLFRSIAEQIFGTQTASEKLMQLCAQYLEENSSKFERYLSHPVDQYLTSVRKAQTCAAHPHLDVFLEIVSHLFDCVIIVYQQVSAQPLVVCTKQAHARTIELCKIGKHYDTIMSRERVTAYAQCQSVLFDLLYSRVFRMPEDEIDFGVGALRHKVSKRKDSTGEGLSLENADDSGNGGESNELSPNKMPFSYRAAKGLDVNIFRNIAFDIWREENLDRVAGEQLLIPGNQCIVQLSANETGAPAVDSEAIIQDYDYEGQIVSAFVQSLGMRVEVPRDAVKPPTERSGPGNAADMAKASSKRRYGVKQDVHWHNRPDAHQRHSNAPNVMYWSGSPGTSPAENAPPDEPVLRRYREKPSNDSQLTVQVSPQALAVAAQQAGYPASHVPSLMGSASPTRAGEPKPLAKVYFNSVGKPAVCKLQLPRYVTPRKSWHALNDGSDLSCPQRPEWEDPVGLSSPRRPHSSRLRCSSESTDSAPPAFPGGPGPTFPPGPPPACPPGRLNGPVFSTAPGREPGEPCPPEAHGDAAAGMPWFFQVNMPYVNNIQFRMGSFGQPFSPPAAPPMMQPFQHQPVASSAQQMSRPGEAQAVRVIPLMDIEHSQQQQQQAGLPHLAAQTAAPAHLFGPPSVSLANQPAGVFGGPAPPPVPHGFPLDPAYPHMYFAPPYYSLAAAQPPPVSGVEGAPLFSLPEGSAAVSPPGLAIPSGPPGWGYSPASAFCYM